MLGLCTGGRTLDCHFSCRVSFDRADYICLIELLSELGIDCFEEGEAITNIQGDLELVNEDTLVTLRFADKDRLYIAKHLIEQKVSSSIVTLTGKNSNYLDEWKKFQKPLEITEQLTIWPSWLNPPDREGVIILDAGYAFGSGSHETTILSAREIAKLLPTGSLIDVGCGSGILSVIAEKLGFREILGIDIDPFAVDAAKQNAIKNNLSYTKFSDRLLGDLAEQYDVVVANIISSVLLANKEHLLGLVKTNGVLILSGILNSEIDLITEKFNLTNTTTSSLGEWAVIISKQ